MKLALERLSESPTSFEFEGDSAWCCAALPEHRSLPRELAEPLRFHLAAHWIGEDLYLEGRLEGALELECSRCLARYRHRLSEPFRLVLEPAGARLPADPEGAKAQILMGAYDSTGVHIEGGAGFRKDRRVDRFCATFPESSPSGMMHVTAEDAVYIPPGEGELSGGWMLTGTFAAIMLSRLLNGKTLPSGMLVSAAWMVSFWTGVAGARSLIIPFLIGCILLYFFATKYARRS